ADDVNAVGGLLHKVVCVSYVLQAEDWRATIFVHIHPGRCPPSPTEGDHPALIRAPERPFRGCQRHIESAACVASVHDQGSSHTQWHLHGANGVLDIAPHLLTRDGVRTDMGETTACLGFEPYPASLHLLPR